MYFCAISIYMLEVLQLKIGKMANFSYLIWDSETKEGAVVDPSFDTTAVREEAKKRNLSMRYVLLTHHHFDHVQEAGNLASATGARTVAHRASPLKVDIPLNDGQSVRLGGVEIRMIHTPGHTSDSCCYLADGRLFTGDTLFIGECGRVDLEDSSPEEMFRSLIERLPGLPDSTIVYPGHDYGKTQSSTIGREKESNYTMTPRTKEEFLKFIES